MMDQFFCCNGVLYELYDSEWDCMLPGYYGSGITVCKELP